MGQLRQGTSTSSALGAELRRLRGARTPQEIASLTLSPCLSSQVNPLEASTVASIECGTETPTVETLHALAVVYRVSPQRFFDLMASERQKSAMSLPETADETHAAYNAALREARWNHAIGLSLHGESLSPLRTDKVVWRARRATCLPYVGRYEEAILLLTECLNSPHLGRNRRFQLLRNLADVYVLAGYLESAVEAARRALDCVPEGTTDSTRVAVLSGLVSSLLAKQEIVDEPDPTELGEVLDSIRLARALGADRDPHWALFLDLSAGIAERLRGNDVGAARLFARVSRLAAKAREDRLRLVSLLNLGTLRRRQGRWRQAEQHLLGALFCALNLQQVNETFEIYVELLLLSREMNHACQDMYFERCQHYYPLVSARTPSVLRFEQLERGGLA
jgi:tetratricopeptide (TPR) repeat protein